MTEWKTFPLFRVVYAVQKYHPIQEESIDKNAYTLKGFVSPSFTLAPDLSWFDSDNDI
jgi:hypothetical protein